MYIDFIHIGFNCNSSSTHSLIITDEGYDDYISGEYGWDYFTVSSREAKKDYLATLFSRTLLAMGLSDFLINKIMSSMYDINLKEFHYIDHDSLPIIPYDWNEKGPDPGFWFDFERYINRKDLVILGGNDNDEVIHPLDNGNSFRLPIMGMNRGRWVARVDGDFWTLFNRSNGNKIRFSFLDNPRTEPSVPDLVDMKITDFCDKNCSYCYMGSTEKGKHASIWDIGRYLYILSTHRVFEVAFGGGEPTKHPDFLHFLVTAKNYGIVPNFTTKNLNWMYDKEFVKIVKNNVGKFAYSANNVYDVQLFLYMLNFCSIDYEKASLQVVDGVVSKEQFSSILELAYNSGIGVVLLGYKNSGRGSSFSKLDTQWQDVVESLGKRNIYPKLSVDTSIAKNYDLGSVPKLTYYSEEGKYSMYIDAVNKKYGASSFTKNLYDFDPKSFNFRSIRAE